MAQKDNENVGRAIIDSDGYRRNVGMVIVYAHASLFWAKRAFTDAWQFPQGGIHEGETEEEAVSRELLEEVGLDFSAVNVIGKTSDWLYYDLPEKYRRRAQKPYCLGQKQKWFLLDLVKDPEHIDLNKTSQPEFDTWRWVSYWHPITQVVHFKAGVYRKALSSFAPILNQHRLSQRGARQSSQ